MVTSVDAVGLNGQDGWVFQDRSHTNPSWFWPVLVGLVAVGVLARVSLAISIWSRNLTADATFFHRSAAFIASGRGYETLAGHPTANHPPVFPLVLALFDLVGLHTIGEQRIAVSILTGGGVLLLGLVGRDVAGPIVGLACATIAAVSPTWFQPSAILMSESVYLIAIPAILLIALRCIGSPTVWRFGVLGILIALAVLIRSEAIDFTLLLGLPVVLLASASWRSRLQTGVALAVGFFLVITPWLARNEIQLGGAPLSTNGGVTLAGSYCPAALNRNNPGYGSFDTACAINENIYLVTHTRPPNGAKTYTEISLNQVTTSRAEHFALAHLSDLPGLVAARELSVWGFGNQQFQLTLATDEGRVTGYERAGTIIYWILLPFVVLGAVVLARFSWKRLIVIGAPVVVVALNSALFYGSSRMRTAAEPSLAILAAIGVVTAISVLKHHRRRPVTPESEPASAVSILST